MKPSHVDCVSPFEVSGEDPVSVTGHRSQQSSLVPFPIAVKIGDHTVNLTTKGAAELVKLLVNAIT